MHIRRRSAKELKIIDINSDPILGAFRHVKSRSNLENDITKYVYTKQTFKRRDFSLVKYDEIQNKSFLSIKTTLDIKPASIRHALEKIQKPESISQYRRMPSRNKIVIRVPLAKLLPRSKSQINWIKCINQPFVSDGNRSLPYRDGDLYLKRNFRSFGWNIQNQIAAS
ncbi:unnamed protein product [Blepharisma stoltei]|uniref:Uncharacterized protein n=1 Tax=Blepharisma stoltei TaxID=1481888 RepID=A0AAU9K535_9CILI|nr:unnamed protein product [Blepharisma stoltei]